MSLSIQHIEVRPELKGLVAKIWAFSSGGQLPADELKLVVPNGMPKLVIPIKNGVSGRYADWYYETQCRKISFIGIADAPAIVDMLTDEPHINVGFEFTPIGAYKLFDLKHSDTRNRIHNLDEIYNHRFRELENRICDAPNSTTVASVVQQFLISRLASAKTDPLLDFCIEKIAASNGQLSVSALEKMTGYSARWLNARFHEKIGLSPKGYAGVVRFINFYEKWARTPAPDFFKGDMYEYFHDHSHFIKDFKRYTGHSPMNFSNTGSEFGRIFYKD